VTTPGGQPVHGYQDLAELLRHQITTGALPAGHAIPSERALRETYGLGKHTVREAVAALRHEGLVDVRRGYAAIVRPQPVREPLVLEPGDVVVARMPTPRERERLGLGDGTPVLHVRHADGTGDVLDAAKIQIVAGGGM
jgi:DNA-binding GntR family transcriptional regulator